MKELKMRFGSLQNMMNASEKDLQKVHGIGKAKSAKIKDLLTRTW
jgi:DNA integrity scanning protein DisA with diadenylate cyclase activity